LKGEAGIDVSIPTINILRFHHRQLKTNWFFFLMFSIGFWNHSDSMNLTKNRGWTQAPAKCKQFLPIIRHQPFYSYGQYVLDTTIRKQTQIT